MMIKLRPSTVKKEVEKALRTASISFAKGSSIAIKVGRVSQTPKEISENVLEVYNGLKSMLPKKKRAV